MYALNLDSEGRVLSATLEQFASKDMPKVEVLPDGDISEYLYIDGEYVLSPKPIEEVEETPSQIDKLEAQITYTAMMTDTMLEV